MQQLVIFEHFQSLFNDLSHRHESDKDRELAKIAAMLILAEEIHHLATTASALAQATANMGTAISQLNTDFNTAWPIIQAALNNPSGTPQADIDNAVNAMNGVAGQLSQMDTDFKSVVPPTTGTGTGSAPGGTNPPPATT